MLGRGINKFIRTLALFAAAPFRSSIFAADFGWFLQSPAIVNLAVETIPSPRLGMSLNPCQT
jgi:hypothetical protein